MNIIRSSIKSQELDLKTLPVCSPLKRGANQLVSFETDVY